MADKKLFSVDRKASHLKNSYCIIFYENNAPYVIGYVIGPYVVELTNILKDAGYEEI